MSYSEETSFSGHPTSLTSFRLKHIRPKIPLATASSETELQYCTCVRGHDRSRWSINSLCKGMVVSPKRNSETGYGNVSWHNQHFFRRCGEKKPHGTVVKWFDLTVTWIELRVIGDFTHPLRITHVLPRKFSPPTTQSTKPIRPMSEILTNFWPLPHSWAKVGKYEIHGAGVNPSPCLSISLHLLSFEGALFLDRRAPHKLDLVWCQLNRLKNHTPNYRFSISIHMRGQRPLAPIFHKLCNFSVMSKHVFTSTTCEYLVALMMANRKPCLAPSKVLLL